MTDAVTTASTLRNGTRAGPKARRAAILATVALAVVLGVIATAPAEMARAVTGSDAHLAALLRFMAVVKAGMAFATLGAILWRLGLPVSFPRFMLYAIAAAVMAAGPAMIWGLVHVGLGAVLLHAGLAGCVILLWRDPAIAARLSTIVARRRRDLAPD